MNDGFFLLVGSAPGFAETRSPEAFLVVVVVVVAVSYHPPWYALPRFVGKPANDQPVPLWAGLPKPRPVLALLTLPLVWSFSTLLLIPSAAGAGPHCPPTTTFRVLASWTRNSSDPFAFLPLPDPSISLSSVPSCICLPCHLSLSASYLLPGQVLRSIEGHSWSLAYSLTRSAIVCDTVTVDCNCMENPL